MHACVHIHTTYIYIHTYIYIYVFFSIPKSQMGFRRPERGTTDPPAPCRSFAAQRLLALTAPRAAAAAGRLAPQAGGSSQGAYGDQPSCIYIYSYEYVHIFMYRQIYARKYIYIIVCIHVFM